MAGWEEGSEDGGAFRTVNGYEASSWHVIKGNCELFCKAQEDFFFSPLSTLLYLDMTRMSSYIDPRHLWSWNLHQNPTSLRVSRVAEISIPSQQQRKPCGDAALLKFTFKSLLSCCRPPTVPRELLLAAAVIVFQTPRSKVSSG